MATNSDRTFIPHGLDAELMALGTDHAVRGMDGPSGVTEPRREARPAADEEETPGLGPLMEADAEEVFRVVDDLVRRQEPLAISRLHQDRHWTNLKLGRMLSTLEKVQDTNQYKQSFPPGMEQMGLRPSAVPNKQADLANKLTETLLVDLPKPNPQPLNDSEVAERGARMLKEFLTQDGGEAGTDDAALFWHQIEGATSRSSTFTHYWVDPTGGGSIPKQIKAHPLATDPATPLDGVDPQTGQPVPTTDYILRYVTPDGQFTDSPADADRQWLPKIRTEKWGREHIRLFPDDQDLHGCQFAIGLFYCTLDEAKRRWPDVAALDEGAQAALCDWRPLRYLALLPAALRARWVKDGGKATDKQGTVHDQRLVFYYAYERKADRDYPEGACLYVNGGAGGTLLGKDTLTARVEVPSERQQDQMVEDVRHLDLPLVQHRLLQDPDEKDAMGKAFLSRVAGTGEATAQLIGAYLEAMDIILHPARFATSTSPLDHEVVEESRAMGSFATVLSKDDFPMYEQARPLPPTFWGAVDWLYEQADASAGLNKPAQGSDQSKEVSGIARKIAVNQSLVSVSRMQQAVNAQWERHWRIKAQLMQKHATAPQLLRYVGEDGASKQEWFTGTDFSMVGGITVATGTGTMMPPQEKVNYIAQLVQMGLMTMDDADEAARPAFISVLGVPENPHQQRIERQVSSWLEGPPAGWVEQYRQYTQQKQAYDQQQAALQQQQQAQAQQQQAAQQQQQMDAERQQQAERHQQEMQMRQQEHDQKMEQDSQQHGQQMQQATEQAMMKRMTQPPKATR